MLKSYRPTHQIDRVFSFGIECFLDYHTLEEMMREVGNNPFLYGSANL